MSRRLLSIGLGILALLPMLGQGTSATGEEMGRLRILRNVPPPNPNDNNFVLHWRDLTGGELDEGLRSLTWYYSTRPDGSDRKRLTTLFRDEFGPDFARRWRTEGLANLDWVVRRDGRQFLSVPGGAFPSRVISREPLARDVVVSTLARPRDLKTGFALALRVQGNGNGLLLTTTEKGLRFLDGAKEVASYSTGKINSNNWYWFEVGLKTRKKEVVLRVRVFDESRSKLIATMNNVFRPDNVGLLSMGGLVLSGPADFAEVYADPWEACWVDACGNALNWNTENVPEGKYYIIAEMADGKKAPTRAVSGFQVEIKKSPALAGMARTPDP